jgi:serine/threonine-protein kinase
MFSAPLEGRYAIRSELGTGGHGRVFLAEDLKLARAVAVKTLGPMPRGAEQEAIQRLEREGRVAASINHPNVCAVSDIGHLANGLPFLVLELLDGETLADRIDRVGKLPVELALHFAEQLLLGLAAAHRRGVVHRDVKPPNLFLVNLGEGREQVKLLDFGTAQVPGGPPSDGATLTRVGLVVGTVDYMAPEQVRGVRGFDARTDVYAVGVVLYEMLTGRRPFAGLAVDALCEAIALRAPPPLAAVAPWVPPAVARAVDQALAVDLSRRHADAGALLRALRAEASAGDDWNLATNQATPFAKQAPTVGMDGSDWDLVTHRMPPQVVAAMPGAPTGSIDVEVAFSVSGEGVTLTLPEQRRDDAATDGSEPRGPEGPRGKRGA